jgi:hypothetical protein
MHDLVAETDELDMMAEVFWHETDVVGGRVRYNHLTGELQVLRHHVPVVPVIYPQELLVTGQWVIVGAAAVVPAQPGGNRITWPNMWSLTHWKDKMTIVVQRSVQILTANGVLNHSCCCFICTDEWWSETHLLGPKHFRKLMDLLPENMPVPAEDLWQNWAFDRGAVSFNHAHGAIRLVRRLDGTEEPVTPAIAGFSLQPAEIYADPQERVLAAVRVRPRPPLLNTHHCISPQPAMSSTFAPPAADMQPASQQQQSATAGGTRDTVSLCGKLSPTKADTPAEPHTIGTQQPPANGVGVFLWLWQQHAAHQITRLQDILVAALGPTMEHYCQLCQLRLLPPDSFAKHVSTDTGHMAQVQACFELKGPSGTGWVQCWAGVAELNHLTLCVSTGELRAREGGSEVAATAAGGSASSHDEVWEHRCAAVQHVTGDAGDQKEQADPRIVPADATPWVEFQDPDTGRSWWWHEKSEGFSWNDPTVMGICGPTESLDNTSGDGGQQHTSLTSTNTAGGSIGEPIDPDVFDS